MNAKIDKLRVEREKNVDRIASLQSRNKEIDGQIVDLENNDIIGLVRAADITPDMLSELILAMKNKPAAAIRDRAAREGMEESLNEE